MLGRLAGPFSAAGYADAAEAVDGASGVIDVSAVPLLTGGDISAGRMISGVVFAVRTDVDRIAKAVAWRDEHNALILRYVLWDTSAAAARIAPTNPVWVRTQSIRDTDTTDPHGFPMAHYRFANTTRLEVRTNRMEAPLQYRWRLSGTSLSGTSAATIGGAEIGWQQTGTGITLNVGLGQSLDGARLTCEAIDAHGVRASDSIQLRVRGSADFADYGIDDRSRAVLQGVHEAVSQWRNVPINPLGPDGPPDRESAFHEALRAGGATFAVESVHLR